MTMRKRVEAMLVRRGIDPSFLGMYDAPGRFYHNWDHLEDLITLMGLDVDRDEDLLKVLAVLFHDAVCVPGEPDNEELSARLFDRTVPSGLSATEHEMVRTAITDTKTHVTSGNYVSDALCLADMHHLYNGDIDRLAADERKVMREFQRFPYAAYRKGRLDFLNGLPNKSAAVRSLIHLVEHRRVRVAVLSHGFSRDDVSRDLVERLERTFDKVVLAMHIPWHAGTQWVGALDAPHWSYYERKMWSSVGELVAVADPEFCTHVVAWGDARRDEAVALHDMLLKDGRCPVVMLPERLTHRRFSDNETHLL